jgi:hypothetical protein
LRLIYSAEVIRLGFYRLRVMPDNQQLAEVQSESCPHCGYWISPALIEDDLRVECPNCEAAIHYPRQSQSKSQPRIAGQPYKLHLAFHRPESPELRSLFRLWLRIRHISWWVIATSCLITMIFYYALLIMLPCFLVAVLIYGLAGMRLEQILRQDRKLKQPPPQS